MTPPHRLRPAWLRRAFFAAVAALSPDPLGAAIIQTGNVTTVLGPTFFVDDAANGGADTDYWAGGSFTNVRTFGGLLSTNQGPTRVTFTGFGFAAHTSATNNNATNVNVSFVYYGADGTNGGGDDVPIGTTSGTYTFTAGGEYVFSFDTPLSADLSVTDTKFGVVINPVDGRMKLKTGPISYQTNSGPRFSVAGVAAPLIVPNRVNLAKYQLLTASSVNGNRLASYATDGDAGNDSLWQSQNWAFNNGRIDFPFPVEVGSAQVFMGVNDTLPLARFGIQYLNGTNWTTIGGADVVGNTNVERNLVFTSPVTATSFRIMVTDPTIRLREFALYPPNGTNGYPLGTDIKLNLALQRPAVASSHTAGQFPINAVDGRTHAGSSWQTTATGVNTLDIEMVANTKIGSVHLYSGSATAPALADFKLRYWNGTAWLDIPGGVVTGNTNSDRIVSFTPVTTTRVRLEFTKSGNAPTVIRELQIFPANTGNVGYPLGTDVNPSGRYADYEQFNDALYRITSVAANRGMAVATGGQPALEPAGITTAQAQYQVLLNLSDGTYRLRNRDTGECLSGAQLSKAAGAALTDEPYRALPHQDWILEPLGGGRYRIVNAWSGLAIDTQGGATAQETGLIQNAASGATTQQWRFNYETWAPKKGLGHSAFAAAMNAEWVYNWGPNPPTNLPSSMVFNPMQWGSFNWTYNTGSGPVWQRTSEWRRRGDGMLLMGFNEPDRFDQSGRSLDPNNPQTIEEFSSSRAVTNAVNLWPQLMALNQPLVGPSPADDGTWLTAFTTDAKNRGFRWEYTAIHDYPSPNSGSSDGLISKIQSYFNDYDLPVWLTEFSFVDWGKNQSWSEEECYQTLAEFLWRAENFAPLRKYALFVFTADSENPQPANSWQSVSPAPRSNSYDESGNLTAFGRLYAAWDSDTTVRPDKTYMIHHRSLRKRMANAGTTNTAPGGRTIRTDGPIVNWTLVPTGTANRFYIVSSIDGRRLSHTTGTGVAPSLAAAGTTGINVEWTVTPTASQPEKGWHHIGHPSSSTRLRLASFNTGNNAASYQMVAASTTDDSVQWRFIVPLPPGNSAPALAAIPDQMVNELTPLTFAADATDASLPGGPLVYSIVGTNTPWGASINSTTGIFTWTPTETQGDGSTYAITIRASDGQLSSNRTVNITVNETNVAPALAAIPPQSVNEGSQLTFTANATDADVPANPLAYSLVGEPAGAVINPSTGVFTWTPSEAQGPGVFNFTVRVSDGTLTHDRPLSVTVNEVNAPPVLAAIPSQSVNAGGLLSFDASATDGDLPANTLVYGMVNAPAGASISPTTGAFEWRPSPGQTPGIFNFAIRVSDGLLTESQPVSVTVVNSVPRGDSDADGDGLSDLLEHACGTDPAVPNANPLKVVSANTNNTLTLQFSWNWQAAGLSWQIRHGHSLTNAPSWPVVSPGTTTTVREGNIDRITISPACSQDDCGFYVLDVILN